MCKLQRQRGIGLLELMLAIAIIAVLLIMATRYFQSAKRNEMLNQTVTLFQAAITGVNDWGEMHNNRYTDSKVWAGGSYVGSETLIATGAIPNAYINADKKRIFTPYGRQLRVGAALGGVVLTVSNIPGYACEQLKKKFLELSTSNTNCKSGQNTSQIQLLAGKPAADTP